MDRFRDAAMSGETAEVNPEQSKVLAEIKKLRGKIPLDEKGPHKAVFGLDLTYTKLTDAGLAHLKGLTKLEELWLKFTKVTEADVKSFPQALPSCSIER